MNTKVTEHFSVEEFACPASTKRNLARVAYPETWVETRLKPLCTQLEIIREALGNVSISVISGYRTLEYNTACGGAKLSQHMQGRAADIHVKGLTAQVVHDKVLELSKSGKLPLVKGLGSYPGFTHVDIRPTARLARWGGSRTVEATTLDSTATEASSES